MIAQVVIWDNRSVFHVSALTHSVSIHRLLAIDLGAWLTWFDDSVLRMTMVAAEFAPRIASVALARCLTSTLGLPVDDPP